MRELDALLEQGVSEKIFSGAQALALFEGGKIYEKSVGHDGSDVERPVCPESFFDLASLTKVLATTLVAMRLVAEGKISLEMPLAAILDEWKKGTRREVRLFHLLQHTAGLPAFLDLYRELAEFPLEHRVQKRRKLLSEVGLLQAPGKETLYSDLGFMLLKEAFAEVTGRPFERLVAESLPAGLAGNGLFAPSALWEKPRKTPLFVATSFSAFRKRRLCGEVHDENAAVMGGLDGHAGLFGTASGVGRFAEALLDALHGTDPRLPPEVLGQFVFWPKDGKRPMGFDRPSGNPSSSGHCFSPESIGHLGFTGTSLWIDIPRKLAVILLTNRVYYGDDPWKIRDFRPVFHDLLMKTSGLIEK